MASMYPSQYLQLDEKLGQIKQGYQADFVLLDNQHQVRQTYIAGKLVFAK